MSRLTLFKNTSAMMLVQGVNLLAPFLVFPIISRMLSIDDFGLVILVFTITSLCYVITDFGFNLSASYKIANNNQNKPVICEILSSAFAIKSIILLIILCAFLMVWYIKYTAIVSLELLLWTFLAIAAQAFQPMWFFQGIEKMARITLFSFISKGLYALCIVIFINNNSSPEEVIKYFAIANVIGAICAVYSIYHEGYKLHKITFKIIINDTLDGFSFFVSRVAVASYNYTNTLLLGALTNNQQVALYGAGEKIFYTIQTLSSPFSLALYPYLSKQNNYKLFYTVVSSLAVLGCFFIALIWPYSKTILTVVFGEQFAQAELILQLFLIAGGVSVISSLFGYPAFAMLKIPKKVNVTVWAGLVMQCIGILYLFLTNDITAVNLVKMVILVESCVLTSRILLFFYYKNQLRVINDQLN
ncbi:oligosaccharide flippase family protein [Pseudoalteromonas sp. K222D]|uniref:oligosaccharide flippase family protein n=1 Tax=Pseudoalteromonas TaxID=53246 RepID=UPI0018CF8E15|nr:MULTISPECIES: oligosaccharide flippase family protein [unclassified Pseudoalteromonas]MBH0093506.1 oligosaccharide flippase family protein [Pseudoalteromonas sp. SCQQ13]MBO7926558.1 oligosaccharide flippase family protein [Pseudoalteromonas sp. K222D]